MIVDARVAAIQQLLRAEALVEQAAGVREAPVFGIEGGQLVVDQRERIEFLQLETQVVELRRVAGLRREQPLAFALDALHGLRGGGDRRERIRMARVVVQQVALRIALQQRTAFALSEDFDEQIENSAETSAFSAPARTSVESARRPMTSPSASIRIDLPAPVSPVSTLKPGAQSRLSSSMIARLRMWR